MTRKIRDILSKHRIAIYEELINENLKLAEKIYSYLLLCEDLDLEKEGKVL